MQQGGGLSGFLMELDVNTIEADVCVAGVAQAGIELNFNVPVVEPHIEVCTFHSAGMGTCNVGTGI